MFSGLSAHAQYPLHSNLQYPASVIPDRSDHPMGSAERQAAYNASNPGSPVMQETQTANTPAPAAAPPSADRTTPQELDDLAAKFRKIREAREAKKEAEQKAAH
jgi:hypothetical protein